MCRHEQARRNRRAAFVLLLVGVAAGIGLWQAISWELESLANYLAAATVCCAIFSINCLLAPVGNAQTTCSSGGFNDPAAKCGTLACGLSEGSASAQDLSHLTDGGGLGGELAECGFDCDFELPFF